MSTLLDWSYVSKQDRRDRQQFTCADPPKRTYIRGRERYHPRPWEMDVQDFLRAHTPGPGEVMLAGRDGNGIAALSAWDESDPTEVLMQAIAVSVRLRRRGGAWARETLAETIGRIRARAVGHGLSIITLTARIDRRNLPSETLCRGAGLAMLGPVPGDAHLDEWGCVLDLKEVERPEWDG